MLIGWDFDARIGAGTAGPPRPGLGDGGGLWYKLRISFRQICADELEVSA
jgi:hypothetical protein